ncbi:Chain A, Purine nucleoside phosphorylase [Singapore grouper iridovirus]|uniref:purine-nucleoside phosphorylase n=1 Tax=Grouper iridovirus TaxID=127569 RepID=Q5YBA4_9VIRU|nr:Chain A, Purine nucleoside phosphorylase [Grouper iridovirus]3KHS_B Chain B, Purine nucleoside phosphorylase [Grouper iridovirus]3KHS_C Chain C, Purine nucleoside phosphorylase [Grouper iridovirus]3KHS_D Chain D, Purine nucleoside phosphorylase [Grouper iridovirus]WRW24642.1 Chain A, Purine nucleoside phosphorylase [Singapore grouper iridovirus]AAT81161.1 purine nucleoside phosphorylase [Grouper iridovirus]AAV91070.1 purine nucleotide phosphorylase [Grouper iridovirus]
MTDYDLAKETAAWLNKQLQIRPVLGIVCGSGLGKIGDSLETSITVAYSDIPNFPVGSVKGHAGSLIFGSVNGVSCVCMKGRFHLYEGHTAARATFPMRVFKALGVKIVVLTNAAGGLNPSYRPGDFMVVRDHINLPGLAGANPLTGPNDDTEGERFPSMTSVYDKTLRKYAISAARELGMSYATHEGVYCCVNGPSFETPAECKILRLMGSDAVGMSTAPETIVAKHGGMRCLAVSLISNVIASNCETPAEPTHEEVLRAGEEASARMTALVKLVIEKIRGELPR